MKAALGRLGGRGRAVDLPPDGALSLLLTLSDVVLVLDSSGRVEDSAAVSAAMEGPLATAAREWTGRPWLETVARQSRSPARDLLREIRSIGSASPRPISQRSMRGVEILAAYTGIELMGRGEMLLVGRDLGIAASREQQLQEAQQAMERDYRRMRRAESRYQLLFSGAHEATFVVEAGTLRVVDANQAAGRLLGIPSSELAGRDARSCFARDCEPAIEALLSRAHASGRACQAQARLTEGRASARVSAVPFRSEKGPRLLMRIDPQARPLESGDEAAIAALVQEIPDAVVLTNAEGFILKANAAFVALLDASDMRQIEGTSLGDRLGRPGVDLPAILETLTRRGRVASLLLPIRGEGGASVEVELSAAQVSVGDDRSIGFVLRRSSRGESEASASSPGPEGVDPRSTLSGDPKDLVGRVPLSELIRDTTDLVERDFIRAALERAGGNRTTAAGILGLSRQALYVKLRRHGIVSTQDEVVRARGERSDAVRPTRGRGHRTRSGAPEINPARGSYLLLDT